MFTKTDVPGIYVDKTTNAVINTDISQYQSLLKERKIMSRIDKIEREIKCVTDNIKDIQNILNRHQTECPHVENR